MHLVKGEVASPGWAERLHAGAVCLTQDRGYIGQISEGPCSAIPRPNLQEMEGLMSREVVSTKENIFIQKSHVQNQNSGISEIQNSRFLAYRAGVWNRQRRENLFIFQ